MRSLNRNRRSGYPFIRIFFLLCLFGVTLVIFSGRLVSLQIANHSYYSELAKANANVIKPLSTTRGEIYDRNGKPLVTNKITYDIKINRSLLPYGTENEVLKNLLELFHNGGIQLADTLPIPKDAPFSIDDKYIWDNEKSKALLKFMERNKLTKADISGDKLYTFLLKKYKLVEADYTDPSILRSLLGLRYEMDIHDFGVYAPYTALKNADIKITSAISENAHFLKGVEIVTSSTRFYNQGSVAAHILGRTGPIFAEEADNYISKGYGFNAIVGKDGVEAAFEDYLRGIDGENTVSYDETGKILSTATSKEPKAGQSVRLTIDTDMQKIAENSLKEAIDKAAANGRSVGGGDRGEDAATGSVVVLNPNNFEVLAMASYPTYDMNTYSKDFNSLLHDKNRPLYDRSVLGIYPPGSTFKIATAAAALTSGTINKNTTIVDEGIYRKYLTYQPHCWIYDLHGTTHGRVDVVNAIKVSCNYFFYEVGDRMGIETLDEYCKSLGLGVKTGIEIGESAGILAGPEYRESQGLTWQPGDTIQAAIGQSDNAFTPLQLASYLPTIVNGGRRYKVHLLKSVDDFYTKEAKTVKEPELASTVSLSEENMNLLKYSMKEVIEEGTAKDIFANYPYSVAGKTGTAQTGKGSDTATFIGFAPYDNPQIVLSVVIENGYKGGNAAYVAKQLFDYYFQSIQAAPPPQQ